MKLYDDPISGNGYKVRLLLAQLAQPYEYVALDIVRGDTRTTAFLEKNPNGKIPVLELDDGTCLPESNAILWYLAEDTSFVPRDRLARAQTLQWMCFEQYSHEPNIATLRFWAHAGLLAERAPFVPDKRRNGDAALRVMDRHLASHRFFAAEQYTIADVALYAYTHVADEGGFELAPYPALRAWLERVRAQPGYVAIDAVSRPSA
jgi:glutathione S-transferase